MTGPHAQVCTCELPIYSHPDWQLLGWGCGVQGYCRHACAGQFWMVPLVWICKG